MKQMEPFTSIDIGILVHALRASDVQMGGLGAGPFVRIVSDDVSIRSVFQIIDSPFRTFATEEEALASFQVEGPTFDPVPLILLVVAPAIVVLRC